MIKSRPRFPWKVIFLTPDGPLPEEKFTSEGKAYLAVIFKRELVREKASTVTRALVYEWNRQRARWDTFEKHDLVAEAAEFPPNKELSPPPGISDEIAPPEKAVKPEVKPTGRRRARGKS